MGGYSIWFQDSGVVVTECFSPRKLADSTAGSELIMASWAGKAILGFRMMHNEIFGGDLAHNNARVGRFSGDGQCGYGAGYAEAAVQRGALCHALVVAEDDTLVFEKVGSADMRSDIFYKFVYPAEKFRELAALVLTGRKDGAELRL